MLINTNRHKISRREETSTKFQQIKPKLVMVAKAISKQIKKNISKRV
jgi:hypothetical protein